MEGCETRQIHQDTSVYAAITRLACDAETGECCFAFSLAVSILVAPTAVAERAPQEWVPDVLEFSDDLDVLSSREIGSTVRMFAIGTHAAPDDLIAAWEHARARARPENRQQTFDFCSIQPSATSIQVFSSSPSEAAYFQILTDCSPDRRSQ